MPEAVAANTKDTAIDKNKVVRMINCFNCVSFFCVFNFTVQM